MEPVVLTPILPPSNKPWDPPKPLKCLQGCPCLPKLKVAGRQWNLCFSAPSQHFQKKS